MLARLMKSQIQQPPAGSVAVWEEGSEKGHGFCQPFCLRESCPPAPALMPNTSVPSCMPLVPFKLLPWWCWSSEGMCLGRSMYRFCKGNCLGLQKFLLPTQSLLVSEKLWGLTFLALEPWAGGPGAGLRLLIHKISLPNFYLPHVGVGPARSVSVPLLPVLMDVVSLISQLSDFHST